VLQLTKAYDAQYLLIEARPGNGSTGSPLPEEEESEALARHVAAFTHSAAAKREQWQRRLRRLKEHGRRTVIWGGGAKGVAFLSTLGIREEIEFAVDINPFKQGKYLPGTGQRIVPPDFLKEYRPEIVIVMNPIYQREIREMLAQMKVTAEVCSPGEGRDANP
jgi:hypothetical protein